MLPIYEEFVNQKSPRLQAGAFLKSLFGLKALGKSTSEWIAVGLLIEHSDRGQH